MSTWNEITIERLDGAAITGRQLEQINLIVQTYVANLDCLYDGSDGNEFDFVHRWDSAAKVMVPEPASIQVDGWSKWFLNADWRKLSARLGPSWAINAKEEWDDDDGGGEGSYYVGGAMILDNSFVKADVNQALLKVLDVSKAPEIIDSIRVCVAAGAPEGTRFIVVRPKEA